MVVDQFLWTCFLNSCSKPSLQLDKEIASDLSPVLSEEHQLRPSGCLAAGGANRSLRPSLLPFHNPTHQKVSTLETEEPPRSLLTFYAIFYVMFDLSLNFLQHHRLVLSVPSSCHCLTVRMVLQDVSCANRQ
ncbi:hypothetical protein GOODEAATRI_029744 [Goodea atripinnis]|uniref:Uncharacterized protein n=1 Tax=Goodea atripinnis TaxID=208336 RepID=A0ABV0Q233_9TELE